MTSFWFYTRFFSAGNPEGHSPSRAAEELDTALRQWEAGAARIMYHGDRGWFLPETNRWQDGP